MNIRYWFILVTFVAMLFGAVPLQFLFFGLGFSELNSVGYALVTSYILGTLIIFLLLLPDMRAGSLDPKRSTIGMTIIWSIAGVFLVFVAQFAAALIETSLFGIEPGSDNTESLVQLSRAFPFMIVIIAILGPIIEEIVFRKVLFGSLHKKLNFFFASTLSSLIFAAAHWDFEHLLIYLAMGYAFAFLYVISKRIIVPIIAHVALNSFVVLVQVVFIDDIERLVEQMEQLSMQQSLILRLIGG
ncbi:CPBP family intramembrane glutamic endopeptidase [Alkalicoccobacillus murimartini]|uniref:Membrane protease YdiL (CAAX protease family) n=1 Tax=Alkalicoccobacillus murimartini TaxID=171685 RepID=A0ABT9YM21_9BACI|nr:type II CAAX endopeptidase family protein [Alkalicoccobacillus murimartini]MDQ0208530.1 membrane protease YdiL (CAAX protease family) [Alkalicoccobacillus murimartini]